MSRDIYATGWVAKDNADGVICAACLPVEVWCECCGPEAVTDDHFPVTVDADAICADCKTSVIF